MFETDDFEKAKKKCIEAEDTSNLESDDIDSIRRRKLRAKKNFSSSEDDEPLRKIKKIPERPPRFHHIVTNNAQENSCKPSNPDSVLSSGTSTSTSSFRLLSSTPTNNDTHTLGRSIQVTPVRTNLGTNTNINNSLGFDRNILSLLYHIKEQNEQILNHLNKKPPEVGTLPNDLPIEIPLKEIEQIEELEIFLKSDVNLSGMVSYLSTLGGKDRTSKTNNILRHSLTDQLATSFNFRGKRQKRPFCELSLSDCIVRAVKKKLKVRPMPK
ncbi:unnamed protein product [Phaedon cochleariae]|uniref:DUF4806 domain-containing protein n=1 Tax=Phaedon cochleariae TaxID=80249 RepID=A0A9N9X4H4_PHACE|nr:unnamed protein product [Phaedon cochleariae]